MGNCLALPVCTAMDILTPRTVTIKPKASNVWALIFCARLLPGCRMEDIPGYRE